MRTLKTITDWANGRGSQQVFWLHGPAGSGKSSVAYTIARRFELTADVGDTIVLGGNFFCSRQVKETRHESLIVRTIAYHLALKCKPFADELIRARRFDTINQRVNTQLQELLIKPWNACRSKPNGDGSQNTDFLFLIDAIDELVYDGSSKFVQDFLQVMKKANLPGLKFLITSRSDPDLIGKVASLQAEPLCQLEDLGKEEVQPDIKLYLEDTFPCFKGEPEMQLLLTFAGSLFICAATLARYLTRGGTTVQEQRDTLTHLTGSQASGNLDELYKAILSRAFEDLPKAARIGRIRTLHIFLCTAEATTSGSIRDLFSLDPTMLEAVLKSLHAVLYTDAQQNIHFYHKSFSDYMLDKERCGEEFWCDTGAHHRRLLDACLVSMHNGLRFNITSIPTSFKMDRDSASLLRGAANSAIPPALRYSCRNWCYHLNNLQASGSMVDLRARFKEFLHLRVLFWIEVMNLLGMRGRCQPMLHSTSRMFHVSRS